MLCGKTRYVGAGSYTWPTATIKPGGELTDLISPKLTKAAQRLQTAAAVRERANRILNLGVLGQLDHFTVDLLRLDAVLDFVVKVTRSGYADLSVPPHARWRHFEVGEVDRWGMLASSRNWQSSLELGRAAVDLAFISVLLDGLAAPGWAYAEAATGETFARGEGLAIAGVAIECPHWARPAAAGYQPARPIYGVQTGAVRGR
jgi:hypothetical protein